MQQPLCWVSYGQAGELRYTIVLLFRLDASPKMHLPLTVSAPIGKVETPRRGTTVKNDYPWQDLYEAAILETDDEKLTKCLQQAKFSRSKASMISVGATESN